VEWRLLSAEVVHLGSARTALFDFSTHLGAEAGSVTRATANVSLAATQRVTIITSKLRGCAFNGCRALACSRFHRR
jgi:hypothetical protein